MTSAETVSALRVILALKAAQSALTVSEIAGVTQLSHGTVLDALQAAEEAGMVLRLERRPGRPATRYTTSELVWL